MTTARRTTPDPSPKDLLYRLDVIASTTISPSFQRVTVGSDELADFTYRGFDHWFRLFTPAEGRSEWRLPTATSKLWYAQWLATPTRLRPHVSNYTVADYRPGARELDIDIVMHRDSDGRLEGRVARWADNARPGDPLALLDQAPLFEPTHDLGRTVLLVADESALPAVLGILRSLPPTTSSHAIVEVPTRADIRRAGSLDHQTLEWVVRDEHAPGSRPGSAALAALTQQLARSTPGRAFAAGEARMATSARRLLVNAGVAKADITFTGYWKSAHGS